MDPALWELLRAEAGTDGGRELEAVVRLAAPGLDVPGVRMVARFGTVATCRVLARDVIAVRARPEVISVKAARGISPGGKRPSTRAPNQGLASAPDRTPAPAPSRVRPAQVAPGRAGPIRPRRNCGRAMSGGLRGWR